MNGLGHDLLAAAERRVPRPPLTAWAHLSDVEFAEAKAACDPLDEATLARLKRRGARREQFGFSELRCTKTMWPSPPRDPARARCIQGNPECACLVEFLDGELDFAVKKEARRHVWGVHVGRHRAVAREFEREVSVV